MIDSKYSTKYKRWIVHPLIHLKVMQKVHPNVLTFGALFTGVLILPMLAFEKSLMAFLLLLTTGLLDTLDGSLARLTQLISPKGAVLDIVSDRMVESAIVLGLYFVEPSARGLPVILMLTSILICVTSFLVVGIFTENQSEKSFHYSPGLMERAEAFIFFGIMILFPISFIPLAYLFSFCVFFTGLIRVIQFFTFDNFVDL